MPSVTTRWSLKLLKKKIMGFFFHFLSSTFSYWVYRGKPVGAVSQTPNYQNGAIYIDIKIIK